MSRQVATITLAGVATVISAPPALPIEALVLGRPALDVAELLPRIFNLCGAAQGAAARLSLGLPGSGATQAETIRDHLLKLCAILPRAFGKTPLSIPSDPAALVGPDGLPRSVEHMTAWQSPAAALAATIRDLFAPGVASCFALPAPSDPLAAGAFENSAAGRQAHHPLLRSVEEVYGRGPLWRYLGIVADLEAALFGELPPPALRDGVAVVAASRGAYALRLRQAGGLVTGMERRTPTDHLMAEGGALVQSLRALPTEMRSLAPALIALHDPCVPVLLREAVDA